MLKIALLLITLMLALVACNTAQPPVKESGTSPNTVQGYARECGEVMARDVKATGEKGEREFIAWTRDLGRLAPPPELGEFHEGHIGFFTSQVVDGRIAPLTLEEIQRSQKLGAQAVAALDNDVVSVLLAEGCLSEIDVEYARRFGNQ